MAQIILIILRISIKIIINKIYLNGNPTNGKMKSYTNKEKTADLFPRLAERRFNVGWLR